MKKLLFVIPTMRMGGAEKALISLLNSLNPERVDIDLFLFEHGGELQKQVPGWVHVLQENAVTRAMTLELRSHWKDLIKNHKFSAAVARASISIRSAFRSRLHISPASSWKRIEKHIFPLEGNYDVAIGFLEGFADFFVNDKVKALKKIAWIHSDLSEHKLPLFDIDNYRRFDTFATITESCKKSFAKAIEVPEDRIVIIRNIVSESQIYKMAELETPQWPKDRFQILTVGRLEYQKGSDIGLEACSILAQKGISFSWHFIGTGSLLKELQNRMLKKSLEDYCTFEGVLENPYPFMKRADLIVQPSRIEGKSIVLDEAKILGKAIVTTDYPSVTDQICDGVTGLISKIDPESIANSVIRLMQNSELLRQLENNNKYSVHSFYKEEVSKFYELIESKQF